MNISSKSHDEIIKRFIRISKEDDPLTKNEIKQIEKSLEDMKKGRILKFDEI